MYPSPWSASADRPPHLRCRRAGRRSACSTLVRNALVHNALVQKALVQKALVPVALVLIALLAMPSSAAAQSADADPVSELRQEIDTLRADYEARIAELERRLAALEAAGGAAVAQTGAAATETAAAPEPAPPDDALARLRAAASAAGGAAPSPAAAPSSQVAEATVGHERNLSIFNPEISATGIFVGRASDAGREELQAQEYELDLQSALDPYSRMRLTLSFADGEAAVEEGWVRYSALPGGLDLLAGRFRQRFGALNRQHLHALPQNDYPLPITEFFGEEGLAQTGLSASWLLPHPWASANEVTVEVTDGDSEAFGGADFEQLSVLGHVKNYWDVSPATYFEWGLSGITGKGPQGGDRRVFGTDLTYHWQPPARSKYRELTWRSEVLLSQRDDPAGGPRRDAWGAYTYLEGLVSPNLYLGLRLDGVEHPDDPDRRLWAVAPYVTWWQSEYVRLRAELRHLDDDARAEAENQLLLQLTWAAGPHKHETY